MQKTFSLKQMLQSLQFIRILHQRSASSLFQFQAKLFLWCLGVIHKHVVGIRILPELPLNRAHWGVNKKRDTLWSINPKALHARYFVQCKWKAVMVRISLAKKASKSARITFISDDWLFWDLRPHLDDLILGIISMFVHEICGKYVVIIFLPHPVVYMPKI